MSARIRLGEGLRRIGSLVSIRQTRHDDVKREVRRARPVDDRAEQIRRQALSLEAEIDNL